MILQHHGVHKEMPSDDNRMDTAFGSLNVIANLFQTLGKGLKRQDSGKRSDISNASSSAYDIWFLPSNCDKKMTLGSKISLAFINKS